MIYCEKHPWFFSSFIRITAMCAGMDPEGRILPFVSLANAQLHTVTLPAHVLQVSGNSLTKNASEGDGDRQAEHEADDNDLVKMLQYITDEIDGLLRLLQRADVSPESQLLRGAMAKIISRIAGIQATMAPQLCIQPAQPVSCDNDEALLKHLSAVILHNLGDAQLDIGRLSDLMNMSRRNLFRRIKLTTGLSPGELINELRLRTAKELLLNSDLKMYEIAERVGFGSRIVFTRNFTRLYGLSPTEFIKNHRLKP